MGTAPATILTAFKWHRMLPMIVPMNKSSCMRATIALDDDMMAKAQALTGLTEKSSLIREALKALIERESARQLARLGGTRPRLKAPPRRRPSRS